MTGPIRADGAARRVRDLPGQASGHGVLDQAQVVPVLAGLVERRVRDNARIFLKTTMHADYDGHGTV